MSKSAGSSWLKFGLFSVGLGQSFVFVLVPPLARDLGLSESQVSLIFAFSAVAWALTSAMWGRASDKYGRRNIAILGLLGYAFSLIALITPLFLAEKNILNITFLFPMLILGRLVNGLVGSATRPAAFAYVADTTSKSKRTVKFARLESSFLIGTVSGPLIGGFLILISNEAPFYIFSLIALIASIGIYKNVENIPQKTKKINILLPARMLYEKGIYEFVEAAKIIKKKNLKASFILVGDNISLNPSCIKKEEIKSWIEEGLIDYLDYQKDIKSIYDQTTIVCLPSWREGFPKVLMEAASCGIPTITTDVPGCRDAIIDKKTGFLVPLKNPKAIAEKIEQLIKNKNLQKRMGKAGRFLAISKFDYNVIVPQIVNLYE